MATLTYHVMRLLVYIDHLTGTGRFFLIIRQVAHGYITLTDTAVPVCKKSRPI